MLRTLAGAGCLAVALGPFVFDQSRRVVDLEAADCSHFNTYSDHYSVARAVRHEMVPSSIGQLDVTPDGNGGVTIEGTRGTEYSITACVSAAAPNVAEAQAAADSVRLRIEGNRVSATEPDRSTLSEGRLENWNVHFVIETPANANVSVHTRNGPISLRDASGRFELRAQNGPISVRGSRGDIDLETQNGPVDVELSGRRFDGHLTAHTNNGPLSVTVPQDYSSGVQITSSSHAPWSCRRAVCDGADRGWSDGDRSLRFGSDPVVVRVSTNNGPVSISP